MRQIDIDFDVWKALTAKLEHEKQSYNDVLRLLLGLGLPSPVAAADSHITGIGTKMLEKYSQRGFFSRGLFLPNGTTLRAFYKGVPYLAKIEDGRWVGFDGVLHSSPSAAANHITGTTVNGLRFWEALRPDDSGWHKLDSLG